LPAGQVPLRRARNRDYGLRVLDASRYRHAAVPETENPAQCGTPNPTLTPNTDMRHTTAATQKRDVRSVRHQNDVR
jgi:hypothetical protein